jgi:hypothetical protein
MEGVPDLYLPDYFGKYAPGYNKYEYATTRHHYRASIEAQREFKGTGPTLSWAAAQPLFGGDETGSVNLDWSVTAGVLFGKQKTTVTGTQAVGYHSGKYQGVFADTPLVDQPLGIAPRSKSVTVPMVDLSLGLSYEIQRFKVGAGYRWERYSDVLDVGYDKHEDGDRTMDGPYFKIAVGFGG